MSVTIASEHPLWSSEAATCASTTLLRTENSAMPRPWTPQRSMTIVSSLVVTRGSKTRSCMSGGHTDAVVDDGERARVALPAVRDEDAARVRVAGVAQQLDDDVLERADVVLRLAALGLGDLEADVAVAEVLLDLDVLVAGDGGHEARGVSRRQSWQSV